MKFLGRYVGQPGELTYAKDTHRYYEQLAKVSPRAVLDDRQDRRRPRHRRAGDRRRSDDQVAREHRDQLAALTDPGRTTEGRRSLLKTAADLPPRQRHALARNRRPGNADRAAYRLIVEETPSSRTSATT
jgi:hypothetical protein